MTLQNSVYRVPFANTLITSLGGSQTFNPDPLMQCLIVECWGGGGGSSGIGATGGGQVGVASGGGSASYARKVFTRAEVTGPVTVTVGAAGAAGASGGGAGGNGGTTIFLTVNAGGGGGSNSPVIGSQVQCLGAGAGGTATGGDVNISGLRGWNNGGAFVSPNSCVFSSPGQNTAYGDIVGAGAAGNVAQQSSPGVSGVQGGAGRVIVTQFLRPA